MLPDHDFQQMHDPLRSSNTMDTPHRCTFFLKRKRSRKIYVLSLYNFKKNLISVEFVHVLW
jgi:hypothetical protein